MKNSDLLLPAVLLLAFTAFAGEALTDLPEGGKGFSGKLLFRGTEQILLQQSSGVHGTEKGLTVSVDVKPAHDGTDVKNHAPDALDIYLFKDKEYFIGRYGDRLYANFHDGTRWCGHTMSLPGVFPSRGKWSCATAVFEPLKGDAVGYSVSLYLDGRFIRKKEFPGKKMNRSNAFVELGYGWGGFWSYHGEISQVRLYPYALSAEKIAEIHSALPHTADKSGCL